MIKLKSKLIITTIFAIAIICISLSIYAANENVEIVKNGADYLIYIKDNLNTEFKFAFSNNQNEEKAKLNFKKAETDSINDNANKIAFINSTTIELFKNPAYMWVKDTNENYIINGIQIDLTKAITKEKIDEIANITKIIPVDTKQTNTTTKELDGKTITTTVGKVILPKTEGSYEYIIVKLPYTKEYENLEKIATRISKFNNETDMYSKIAIYKEFNSLVEKLKPNPTSNWNKVEENEIEQPADAEDGTKYVLWINEKNGNTLKQDVQFLTSQKEVSEEKIIEKITTKLPVTYDNNTLLVVLVILVITTIVVGVRIKVLSKQENKE